MVGLFPKGVANCRDVWVRTPTDSAFTVCWAQCAQESWGHLSFPTGDAWKSFTSGAKHWHIYYCAELLVHFLPLHICFKSSDTLCSHSLVQVLTYGVFWGRFLFYFRNLALLALLAWEQKSQPGPGVVILNPWLQIRINWGSFKKYLCLRSSILWGLRFLFNWPGLRPGQQGFKSSPGNSKFSQSWELLHRRFTGPAVPHRLLTTLVIAPQPALAPSHQPTVSLESCPGLWGRTVCTSAEVFSTPVLGWGFWV